MARGKRCICIFTTMLLICVIITVIICVKRRYQKSCPEGSFSKAAVAADSETCSDIGRDILKEGGSAADAAIAALLCTSVVNPQSMGIGGGAIFTIMGKNGTVKIINARETVPKVFKGDFSNCSFDTTGSQWIGVPSEIRGYERVHKLYGRLPWSHLFQRTIRLAREGVKISKKLADYLSKFKMPIACQLFRDAKGNMLKEGDIVKFEKLADTLEKIAERGADEFYTGETARDLISDIQEAGGILTLEDLRSVEVSELEPWNMSLGDYTMYFPPPPSGAALVSFILNVMEGYNLNPASLQKKEERVLTYHRYVEAIKFAKGRKKFMRDSRFNTDKEAFATIQKEFAENVRKKITDNSTHDDQYYSISSDEETHGTTHLSVLDEDGMAVSVTSSINYMFGCGDLSKKTGVILNSQMTDFCKKAKQVQAGERPPSSMAPMILRSTVTNHIVVIGGAGGDWMTTAITMVLMNHLWLEKSLNTSIAEPVVYLDPENALQFEENFDADVIEGLKGLGHTVKEAKAFYNVVNGVSKKKECIEAVSDARKMGKAAGY
ncbi:glutathione hydrolase 5 proenzyme-like [Colossoma macropomum]|uniref:glutathione hydrolase 5 proenzyme-like n=1 Tax=Colossoma macropomum TaxID=42526 RepID=UPI001863DEB0|nr:glutathione hydrolase 5 proenzyme-like [Colossoma macropomum]